MPITDFQRDILRLLASHRTHESHVAGGLVINRSKNSLRYSKDIDIFHDLALLVESSAKKDAEVLEKEGYTVRWVTESLGFYRAVVSKGEDSIQLDWAEDSSFRFFPVQPDDEFGFVLHPADLATNKALALAGRSEIRDFIDIIQFDQNYLSLGAIFWAACGKDPGYTPDLLMHMTNRHSRYQPEEMKAEKITRSIELTQLKAQWLRAREKAETLINSLPAKELGCLYLDQEGNPVTPDPKQPEFSQLIRHYGSYKGAWPEIVT